MDGYRIRRGERETRVPTLPAIRQAVAAGRLRMSDEVWLDEAWVPLTTLLSPKPAPVADDPWAAWNDADEADGANLVASVRAEADELPMTSVAPMPPALASSEEGRVAAMPVSAMQLVDDEGPAGPRALAPDGGVALDSELVAEVGPEIAVVEPLDPNAPVTLLPLTPVPPPAVVKPVAVVSPAPRVEPAAPQNARPPIPFRGGAHPREPEVDEPSGPSGQLIDFPRVPPTLPTFAEPPARQVAGPTVRPWRVAIFVALGASVLVIAWAWVRMENANARALAPLSTPKEEVVGEDRPGAGHLVKDDGQTLSTEKSLRATPLGEPRALRNPGDLGDALLIDLQNLKIETIRVDAPVTQWGGKKGKDPLQAEVRVTVQGAGEPDRELGGVALAVGRYKSKYTLELPVIEVTLHTDEGDRRYQIDQVKAEQFAQGRIGLAAALGV